MTWTILLTDYFGNIYGELNNADERNFSFPLNRLPTASFRLKINHPWVDTILTTNCLIKIYRNQTLVFHGPIISVEEVSDITSQTIMVNAAGAFWRLQKRMVGKSKAGFAYGTGASLIDRSEIARRILQETNAEFYTGISEGVVEPTTDSALGPDRFKPVGEIITELSATVNAYDFEVAPTEPTVVAGGTKTLRKNYIKNPSVTTNTTDIASNGTATITRVTSAYHSSPASAQVVTGASGSTNGVIFTADQGVAPTNQVTASAYVKGNAGGEVIQIGISERDSGGAGLRENYSGNITLTTKWKRIEYTRTMGASTVEARVKIVKPTTGAITFFVDDVQSEIAASSTTFSSTNTTVIFPQIGVLNLRELIGTAKDDVIFEYGTDRANVASYSRTQSWEGILNQGHHLPTGFPDGTLIAPIMRDSLESQALLGLHEETIDADMTNADLRTKLVDEHISIRKQRREIIAFTPVKNASPQPFVDYIVGDQIRCRAVVQGQLRFDVMLRVWGINVQLDNSGDETVELELAMP